MINLIFDGEYYYFFRSLNSADMVDYRAGSKSIQTDAVRYLKSNDRFGKYRPSDNLSLEELYDHVKMRYLHETNCISLSTDPNVSLTYHDYRKYAIVKARPEEIERKHVFNAGMFFREGLENIINEAVEKITDETILRNIERIERAQTVEDVADALVAAKMGKSNTVLRKRQYLNAEEQLQLVKTLAKFKYLERNKIIDRIIPNANKTEGNNIFLNAMGMAYTSGENIHYGEIREEEFFDCPPFFMDALALVEQARKKGVKLEDINRVRGKIFDLIKSGYNIDVASKNFSNGKQKIDLSDEIGSLLTKEYLDKRKLQEKITLEKALGFANKGYTYTDLKVQIPAIQMLAEAKLKQRAVVEVLSKLIPDENLKQVLNNTICINRQITFRRDGEGYPITDIVNVLISNDNNYKVPNDKTKILLDKLNKLSNEELVNIIKKGIDFGNIDQLLQPAVRNKRKIQLGNTDSKSLEFMVEAIIDECKKEYTGIPTADKNRLAEKILHGEQDDTALMKLYNTLKGINYSKSRKYTTEEVFAIIMNMAIDGGIGKYKYEDLLKANENELKEMLLENQKKLHKKVSQAQMDFFVGKGKTIDSLKKELLELGIEESVIESEFEKNIKNVYNAKKIVEECGTKLEKEEKKTIIAALLNTEALGKEKNISIEAVMEQLTEIGLKKKEAYSCIINIATNPKSEQEYGFSYESLLQNPDIILEFKGRKTELPIESLKSIEKEVVADEKDGMKERLANLGISGAAIEEKNERNITTMLKILEEYQFNRPLSQKEKCAIGNEIIKNYTLNADREGKLDTLINNLVDVGLDEQQAYGYVINLALNTNATIESGYTYTSLLDNPQKVYEMKEKGIEFQTKLSSFSIKKAVSENALEEEFARAKDELKDLGISEKTLAKNDKKSIVLAKQIVEEHDFGRELDKDEKRGLVQAIINKFIPDEKSTSTLPLLARNLSYIGLTDQEVSATLINMALNTRIIEDRRFEIFSLLKKPTRIFELKDKKHLIDTAVTEQTITKASNRASKIMKFAVSKEKGKLSEMSKIKKEVEALQGVENMIAV